MKILILRPITNGIYKDDTMMFIEGLKKYYNHEIIDPIISIENNKIILLTKQNEVLGITNFDLIWCPYEPLTSAGIYFKNILHVPLISHFEIMPKEKFSLDKIEQQFFNDIYLPNNNVYLQYKQFANYVIKSDISTYISPLMKPEIERLVGKHITKKFYVKPYPLDNEMLHSYYNESIKQKNQICSIFRLVNTKRGHHIIKALSMIKNAPKLIFIGDGPEKEKLKHFANNLNINVEFVGRITDKEKAKIIQESMFCIHLWAWLPVGEAAYFKKVSIVYDDTLTRNKMRNMPIYTELNNITQLSIKIKYLLDNKIELQRLNEKAYSELINNKTDIYFLNEATKRLNDIFLKIKK